MYVALGDDGCSIDLKRHFSFRGVLLGIKEWCTTNGGKISTSELSVVVGNKKSKVKRHTRELLGRDLKAGQSTGYARMLFLQQAIEVYLYGLLIRYLPQEEIRQTIRRVIFRLKEQGEILK